MAPSVLNFELVGDVWSVSCSGNCAQKNSSWCPLNVRLDRAQSFYGCFGEKRNLLSLLGVLLSYTHV
jgi:hypothetical protein